MSDEKKESRINIEDLPQAEQELTTEEAKDVKGGLAQKTWLPSNASADASDANQQDAKGINPVQHSE